MTDRHEWSSEEIVAAFYGQSTVEQAFKNIKNPYHLAVTPGFHWTDQKIEIHVFCCVIALMLCTLLRRELQRKGIDRSIPSLLEDLGRIQEVAVVYPAKSEGDAPKVSVTLSELSEDQGALYGALDLDRCRSK